MDISKIARFETHSHSEFSNIRLIDSINKPKDMILTAYKMGLKGIVLTDHEALCGHVDWLMLEKQLKEQEKISNDFKCGLGNEIYLVNERKNRIKYYHFILIAKNTEGHRALRELSSSSWYNMYKDRNLERVPTLKSELKDIVNKYPNTLIATTACLGGELDNLVLELCDLEEYNASAAEIKNKKIEIVQFIKFGKELFGDDFYIECAPSQSADQLKFNNRIKQIAKSQKVKMIFATDAHYLTKEYRQQHKAYLNSKEAEREVDDFYAYSHLQDNEEAYENLSPCFTEQEFCEMCNNTMEIYDKIESYNLFHNPIIPRVDVKEFKPFVDKSLAGYPTLYRLRAEGNNQERYWVNSCLVSLKEKHLENDEYLDRLEKEADVIDTVGKKLGNCLFEYFNTFQHFIDLFWECGSLSGPGRGSSVCFLSNYLLGITKLDPIEWGLTYYWRFINKDRLELP